MAEIVNIVAILWIVVVLHEFGHLSAAVALGRPVSSVHLGSGPPVWAMQYNGIHLRLFMFPFRGAVVMAFPSRKRWKNIVVLAAGPAANFVTAATLLPCTTPETFLRLLATISIYAGILNLLPHKGSDGQQILKEIRIQRLPA